MSKSSSNGKRTRSRTVAVLSFGANIGNREDTILCAVDRLNEAHGVEVIQLSSLYETEPIDISTEHTFINAVCVVETSLDPPALLSTCQGLEREFGRDGSIRGRDRTLDIDIILYGNYSVVGPELEIPHPRFMERPFVLIPLGEIAPTLRRSHDQSSVHGITGKPAGAGWVRKVSSRSEISGTI